MPKLKAERKKPATPAPAGPPRPAPVDAFLRELDGLVERLAAESANRAGKTEGPPLAKVALLAARWIVTRRLLDLELAAKGTHVSPGDTAWRVEDAWIKAAIEAGSSASSFSSAPKGRTDDASTALGQEMATYRDHLPEMLREHDGEFVLIKGREIVGFFRDDSAAIREGRRRFGIVDILVKEVSATERVVYLPNVVV